MNKSTWKKYCILTSPKALLIAFIVFWCLLWVAYLACESDTIIANGAVAPVSSAVQRKVVQVTPSQSKKVQAVRKTIVKPKQVSKVDKLSQNIHELWKRPETEANRIAKAILSSCDFMYKQYGYIVHPEEVAGIIAQESGFNPHVRNGLMQTTYMCRKSIAKSWGVTERSLSRKVNDIESSVKMGTYYFAKYKTKYSKDMALVVYNHGFSNSKRHLRVSRGLKHSYLNKVTMYTRYFKEVLK